MAVTLPNVTDTIDVPLRRDTALDMTREEYDEFLKTGDMSLLKYKPGQQATFFRLRLVLPWALQQKVEDQKMGIKGGKAVPRMSFVSEEVRCSLVDIINPSDVPDEQQIKFQKGSDAGANPELMARLAAGKAVDDLWQVLQAHNKKDTEDLKKKK